MPPNYLFGLVPFDSLGARVPACDVAVGVEHENRVVPYLGHHVAETLLDRHPPLTVTRVFERDSGLSRQHGK